MSQLLTVAEILAAHARLQPDKIGVRDSQRALTFGQWNERASRLANALRHGRNAGYPAPPVQTRTCSFPASGSSVALASAQGRTVISSRPCLLWPAGRLTHAAPVRHVRDECPVQAVCFRRDLPPVVGFPHLCVRRSIRLPRRIRRASPVTGLLPPPATGIPRCSLVSCSLLVLVSHLMY